MAGDLGEQQVLALVAEHEGDAFGGLVPAAGITQRIQQQCDVAGVADGGRADPGIGRKRSAARGLRAGHCVSGQRVP